MKFGVGLDHKHANFYETFFMHLILLTFHWCETLRLYLTNFIYMQKWITKLFYQFTVPASHII